ncbi:GMC family oxidoreductase [Psychrobacter sp. 1U2]|uniref:GMC family oxidoreductase n=1 Tax=Psychrobacter sp. 1U2 TaxID=3453577 RepID=UPI003F44E513
MEFDYVIIGGGSAGCVMASRLSEDPNISVCLLEFGGDGKDLAVRVPAGVIMMMRDKPVKINNWAFDTVPQTHLNNRIGYQPRGQCLGGSSAINAMVYTRGSAKDYNRWADNGCEGWGYDDMLPFFKKAENNIHGGDEYHGDSGPLHVSELLSPRPISKAFVDACVANGLDANDDFNGTKQDGAGLYQVTHFHGDKQGQRCSAAAAYLHPVDDRPNLTIITGAMVSKVIIEDKRATGVAYVKHGEEYSVRALEEVLLCAGAFGSPKTLMLSGIGPKEHLEQHGIEVVQESPDVGGNLQDHLDVVFDYKVNTKDIIGIGLGTVAQMMSALGQWRKDGTGILSTNYAEGGAFYNSTDKTPKDWPDTQLHFVISRVINHGRELKWGYGVSVHSCYLRPESRGTVRLASTDPSAPPLIDPNYLSNDKDVEFMVAGAERARAIMAEAPLAKFITEDYAAPYIEKDGMIGYIRNKSDTIYHPVGTCRMGADELSVVDTDLKVRGIEGLRVIDASIMPTLISANTNAPTIAIAEKIAEQMKSERHSSESVPTEINNYAKAEHVATI